MDSSEVTGKDFDNRLLLWSVFFFSRNCKNYSFFCVKMLCCCPYSMMVWQHKTFTIVQTVSLHYFQPSHRENDEWISQESRVACCETGDKQPFREVLQCINVFFFFMCAWINARVISSLLVIIIHIIPIAIPQQTTTVTALLSSHYCHPHLNEPLFISVLEHSLGL